MGEAIEARYKGGSAYYKGKIVSANANGTYDIRYDDGDEERAVPASKIRSRGGAAAASSSRGGASDSFREGDKIEARYRGREKYPLPSGKRTFKRIATSSPAPQKVSKTVFVSPDSPSEYPRGTPRRGREPPPRSIHVAAPRRGRDPPF